MVLGASINPAKSPEVAELGRPCRDQNPSDLDSGTIYGVLTAATAVSSGLAGARAAYLSREASPSNESPDRLSLTKGGGEVVRAQQAVREAVSERCAGAQNAAAWLATSTALFGVASTRPAPDGGNRGTTESERCGETSGRARRIRALVPALDSCSNRSATDR